MVAAGKTLIQALTLGHLLAASWNVAADEIDPVLLSSTGLTSAEQTATAQSGNVETAPVDDSGMLSFLVPGIGWPLFGGVLVLAAVNGRKPKIHRNRRA